MDGDELVGLCSYHTFDVFTDPIAVMDETYVVKKYHRTDLGRRLVATGARRWPRPKAAR